MSFSKKWELKIHRDPAREQALFDRLKITGKYIVIHDTGDKWKVQLDPPPAWTNDRQVVRIEPLTDNPFDWITTLERAERLIMLDSCFSNLVEQLNLQNEKYLVLRSVTASTPVYKNNWRFFLPPPGVKMQLQVPQAGD